MTNNFQVDRLKVKVFNESQEMGKAAAKIVIEKLNEAIAVKGTARIILATGTSQFQFLQNLRESNIDWSRIIVFHLDEYLGLSDQHPASFRKYLRDQILDSVKPKRIHFLHGDASNLQKLIRAYVNELERETIDIACIGIGENGHIAFNDPHVADFDDPVLIKPVRLDEMCRKQQLDEGWFRKLSDVPTEAITLTIPAIMRCKMISCVVPDSRKAQAVYNTLNKVISTDCPASIIRTHPCAHLFLDRHAASKL